MKHLFSTIAFALLLSTNHVTAFNGGDMMEQGHGNDKAQVDNKTGQTDATKKAQAEAAKNKRNAPVNPNGNINDAQLMTEGADADRHGNRERVNSGQQQQQQEADPSRQEADTTTVDTTAATTEVTIATPNANAGKDEESRGAGNMKMWLIVAVALIVIIYFALRKKPVNNKRSAEPTTEENNADKKFIATLRGSVARLEADIEALRQQNTRLGNELEKLRSQQVASNNMQPQVQNDVPVSKRPRSIELYANILNGMVFPSDDMQPTCDEYTVFVLTVSGNEGTFKVNDAPNAQLYLISNFAYSVASAVEVKSKSASAKVIATVKPGRVRKTGNGWTIVKKAVVELR